MKDYTEAEQEAMLRMPFRVDEIGWAPISGGNKNSRALVAPYVDARAVQDRLDAVFGLYGWRNGYADWKTISYKRKGHSNEPPVEKQSQLCCIEIYCKEIGQWIPKVDVAEMTDIEPVKGGCVGCVQTRGGTRRYRPVSLSPEG